MTEQLTLAEQARDEAIKQVARPAADWIEEAVAAVAAICRSRGRGGEFTTDAIWAVLNRWGVEPPAEHRAMGAVMKRVPKLGLAVPTDRTRKSTRVVNHACPLRVWRIL